MCFQTTILLSIFSFSNYFYCFCFCVCLSLVFFTQTDSDQTQFLSPIIYNWKTNKSNITSPWMADTFTYPWFKFLWGTPPCIYYNSLRSLGTQSVYRQSQAECSQVICKSYSSRCKGYREFGFRVRGQGNGRKPERAGFRFKVRGRI